jgi:hypothetical protein
MQYSTLEEAFPNYPTHPISQQNNKRSINKKKQCDKFINDYTNTPDCYYKKEGIDMPSCESFANGNGNGNGNGNANANGNANGNANANANGNANGNGNGNANANGNGNGNANSNANGNANGNGNYASYASMVKKDCSPLQPPVYTLPIDSNAQNAFKKAVETSLNTNIFEKNKPDKFSIKPYDYDEYDAYLSINDIQTNNKDETPEYRTTPFIEDYLKDLRNNFKTPVVEQGIKINDVEQFTNFINNTNNIKVDINLYNLFLFIFIGIIIILLCDQITKLAIIVANKNI